MTNGRACTFLFCALFCALVGSVTELEAQLQEVAASAGYNPNSAFFSFNGHIQLYGEYSNRIGSFMDKDPRYAYTEFAPSFAVFGIPMSATFLYSTEDRALRQHINNFSISINPTVLQNYIVTRAKERADQYLASRNSSPDQARDSLEKMKAQAQARVDSVTAKVDSLGVKADSAKIKEMEQTIRMDDIRKINPHDLNANKDLMEKAGLLSTYEKIMMLMPRVSIGTTTPQYSELTLNGIAINGVDIEWNPGRFYFAYSSGTVLNPIQQYHPFDPFKTIDTAVVTQPVYARSLTGVRIGAGTKAGSHVILTAMKSKDDPNSVTLQSDTVAISNTPQENILVGLDANANIWENHISLGAEGVLSLFTSDVTSSEISIGDDSTSAVLRFFHKEITLRVTSFWDWAALGNCKINLPETGTRFSAIVRRIGAGYRSLGLLNQRNDYVRYDARIDQSLFSRQLMVGGFIRKDYDNLIDWKRATTNIDACGVTAGIMIHKWPFLRLMYAPYYQRNNAVSDSFKVDNTTSLFNATLGYAYKMFGASHSTTITMTTNSISTFQNRSDFEIQSLSVGHSTSFVFPLTVSFAIGQVTQKSSSPLLNFPSLSILNAELSASYIAWDIWNLSGGVTVADEQTNGTRTGFFAALNVPIYDVATFDLRAEKNVYKTSSQTGGDQFLSPYNETVLRATLSKFW